MISKKFKKAMMLFISAITLLFSGCGNESPDSKKVYKGMDDSSSVLESSGKKATTFEKLTIESLPSSVEVEIDNNHCVTKLEGKFIDVTVEDESEASEVISMLSEIIQCDDPSTQLRFDWIDNTSVTTVYSFRQYYNDIPVTGVVTNLHVKNDTHQVCRLQNSFIPRLSLDTVPKITQDDIKKQLSEKYNTIVDGEPQLSISTMYDGFRGSPKLIWTACLKDSNIELVIAYAMTGEILEDEPRRIVD